LDATENAALPVVLDGVSQSKAKDKATEWLEKVDLGDRLKSRPDQLSGGQQQRVAIAVGLLFGALAALLPARQAARMDIIRVLRYE
jgi:putative ABC transport system ATP-binding protein